MSDKSTETKTGLSPYISTKAAWALAVGTSVGWGSLVVTGNTYLSSAGPLGSVIGIIIGALVMLIIARNYHYMANRYPSAGGIYTYTKNIFGYDRAFLISWFLSLIYISMFWANATSLPLFARYFFGNTFKFAYLYTIFGYDVYLGEALLSIVAIILISLLCIKSKKITAHVMFILVAAFVIGITVCFGVAIFRHGGSGFSFDPQFIPDKSSILQISHIAFISPWAFIGFESITHSSEEFKFSHKKLYKILVTSIIVTTAIYVFVTLLSVTAYPPEYESWLEYIKDLGNIEGVKGIPAFYAASHYLGNAGIILLSVSLFALVVTSLIGNLRALSRLFRTLSEDDIIPPAFSKLNKKSIPENAILLVAGISLLIPFVGRTAIGWIVDVTTLGSTLLYGFVSAAAFKLARKNKDKTEITTGILGLVIMICFAAYLLLPSLFSDGYLATETYMLFIVWSIFGFIYFRYIISKDHARRFGKAIIVWLVLLSLVVFMTMVWTVRFDEKNTNESIIAVQQYYDGEADEETLSMTEEEFLSSVTSKIHVSNTVSLLVVIGLFALSLGIMLGNYRSMKKWENAAVKERDRARDIAYRDPLTGVKSKHAYVEAETDYDDLIAQNMINEFSVVVCDVNGLKHINDTYGHKEGDKYIVSAGHLICDHFKHSPVYRIGGDEFIVILEGTDYSNRKSILDDINNVIEGNIGTDNVIISIGSSDFIPGEDNKFHAVFERADVLMYDRKMQLKNMGARTRE